MRLPAFNLSFKLTICLIASMVIIYSVVGYRNVELHKQNLEEMTIASAERISDTIKRSTRHGMLINHRADVYDIIRTIGRQPGINKIRIYNEEGRIGYSTDERELHTVVNKKAEACYVCHIQDQPLTRIDRPDHVRIFNRPGGERILGLINPINNEPSCYNAACHVHPPDQRVLGVLDVTLSLARADDIIAQGHNQLILNFAVANLIICLIVGGLIWVLVHKPVQQLIAGTQRVAAGDLDYKIDVSSGDEIGELAASFNRMTGQLKSANDQVTEWTRTLESRVEEKTVELRRAHDQMLHVERMASIGKLAAIVAHEINNPLAGILTYSKLLLKKMRNGTLKPQIDEKTKKQLEMIASESARCGEIVKSLLQFSRQTSVDFRPHDVNELIGQSIRLVQHKIDLLSLKTEILLAENIPTIVCDGQQMKQVLVALLINACEAVSPGEGALQVRSRWRPEPGAVEISVRDNGIGMDRETQRHIFEPFFSTKEQGKGVGLGLAVVYGIVHRHSGEINVISTPGRGTTITILLPERPEQDEVSS